MLVERYNARKIDGTATRFMDLLENSPKEAVGILHFAGHGSFGEQTAANSRVYFSDQDLSVMDIRRSEVILGKRCGTLVIFNACEVGASGSVLGSIGGWAEAFLRGGFSGFVGPLWSVYDEDALQFTRELFERVRNEKISVGQALQLIRITHRHESPTFLAYLYYGDVMASVS
jgi:CHAT domain-containing protein